MTAVDTNVIVRLLTGDDAAQYQKAYAIFANNPVFIPDTVVLETEWVLRFAYKFEPDAICAAFSMLLGLPNVRVSRPAIVCKAIDWHRQGLDFADALHLASSQDQRRFVTFDAKFIRKAKGIASCRVEAA